MGEPVQTGPLFSLPEYERAFKKFFWQTTHELTRAKSPFLGMIQSVPTPQVTTTATTLASGQQFEIVPIQGASEFTFDWPAAVAGDLGTVLNAMDDAAAQQAAQLVPQILDRIGAMSEAAGQTVDAGGKPISHELMLEILEKIDIDFDDEDKPIMPSIVGPPKMGEAISKLPPQTEEQKAAWDAMLERKRQAFHARRRTRRIS